MQKTIFLLLLLCHVGLLAQNNVTLHCIVENKGSGTLTLHKNNYFIGPQVAEPFSKQSNNQFACVFNLDRNRIVQFHCNNKSAEIYLEPGDSLKFILDEKTFPATLQFSGKGAANNTFLFKFNQTFKNEFEKAFMEHRITSTTVDAYEMAAFNDRKKEKAFLMDYAEKNQLSAGFKTYLSQLIEYNYWNYLLAYPIVNANSNKGLTVNPLPAVMLENFDKSRVGNDTALIASSYRSFLSYFVTYFVSEANGFNKFTDLATSMQKKYYFANQNLKNEAFRFYLANYLYDECEKNPAEAVKKNF